MNRKILFVDDDVRILIGFKRRLRKNFDFHIAESGQEALELIAKEGPFAVIISDQQMPGMTGIAFLKEVMARDPLTIRIMLTGNADKETAVASVNETGVFRYLNKPCPIEKIVATIEEGLAEYNSAASERELLESTLAGSVKLLVDVLSANDPKSFASVSAMRVAGRALARRMHLRKAWSLDIAILLSTLGEAMLPAELRTRMARGDELTEAEHDLVMRAPETARKLISNIPRLEEVAAAVHYRDKGYDGSGFPRDGVAGDAIPVIGRILHLLRALHTGNPSGAWSVEDFDRLAARADKFDPVLVALARECLLETADAEQTEPVVLQVSINEFKPGDVTCDPIKTQTGDLALAADTTMTEASIERVRQFDHMRKLIEPVRVRREVPVSGQGRGAA